MPIILQSYVSEDNVAYQRPGIFQRGLVSESRCIFVYGVVLALCTFALEVMIHSLNLLSFCRSLYVAFFIVNFETLARGIAV